MWAFYPSFIINFIAHNVYFYVPRKCQNLCFHVKAIQSFGNSYAIYVTFYTILFSVQMHLSYTPKFPISN